MLWRDALLAAPIIAIFAQAVSLVMADAGHWSFVFAAVSGVSLLIYAALEWRRPRSRPRDRAPETASTRR